MPIYMQHSVVWEKSKMPFVSTFKKITLLILALAFLPQYSLHAQEEARSASEADPSTALEKVQAETKTSSYAEKKWDFTIGIAENLVLPFLSRHAQDQLNARAFELEHLIGLSLELPLLLVAKTGKHYALGAGLYLGTELQSMVGKYQQSIGGTSAAVDSELLRLAIYAHPVFYQRFSISPDFAFSLALGPSFDVYFETLKTKISGVESTSKEEFFGLGVYANLSAEFFSDIGLSFSISAAINHSPAKTITSSEYYFLADLSLGLAFLIRF